MGTLSPSRTPCRLPCASPTAVRAPDRPLVGALGGGLLESPRSGRLRPKTLLQQTKQ